MGPLRGDGNFACVLSSKFFLSCREDGSPSWGRKLDICLLLGMKV